MQSPVKPPRKSLRPKIIRPSIHTHGHIPIGLSIDLPIGSSFGISAVMVSLSLAFTPLPAASSSAASATSTAVTTTAATTGTASKPPSVKPNDLVKKIKDLDQIIPAMSDPKARGNLLLERASLRLELSRIFRAEKELGQAQAHAKKAREDAHSAAEIRDLPKDRRSYAKYLLGVAYFESGDSRGGALFFEESLKLDPATPYKSIISVYLGDHYLKERKFNKAVSYYNRPEVQGSGDTRSTANFKTAVALARSGQTEQAEKDLLEIALDANDPFADDALAEYIAILSPRAESEIVRTIQQNFGANGDVGDESVSELASAARVHKALYLAWRERTKRGMEKTNQILFKSVLDTSSDLAVKTTVIAEELALSQKARDPEREWIALKVLMDIMAGLAPEARPTFMAERGRALQPLIEASLRERIKNNASKRATKSTRTDRGRLKELLVFYVATFPTSALHSQALQAWITACSEEKDPVLIPLARRTAQEVMMAGQFHTAVKLLEPFTSDSSPSSDLAYEFMLARLGDSDSGRDNGSGSSNSSSGGGNSGSGSNTKNPVTIDEIRRLHPTHARTVQSLLAITQPDLLLRLFEGMQKPSTDFKQVVFLAFQIKSGRLLPALDDKTKVILDEVLPKELRPLPLLPSETLATRLPPLHMAMWPWPEHPSTSIIRDLANHGRLAAALIALDLLKAAKRLSPEDHIALRSGALLTASRSEAMQHYVYRELKTENKESLWH